MYRCQQWALPPWTMTCSCQWKLTQQASNVLLRMKGYFKAKHEPSWPILNSPSQEGNKQLKIVWYCHLLSRLPSSKRNFLQSQCWGSSCSLFMRFNVQLTLYNECNETREWFLSIFSNFRSILLFCGHCKVRNNERFIITFCLAQSSASGRRPWATQLCIYWKDCQRTVWKMNSDEAGC